jgi:hypothetical protein
MKVANAIKRLQAYDPDDELIIAWWDFEMIPEELKITEIEWSKVCETLDDLTPIANEEIYETAIYKLAQLRDGNKQ